MASSGDGNGGNDRNQRVPKDMKGLLKFCVENTKAEDPTSTSHFEEMSDEKKEWLECALKEMSVSPVERMLLCIKAVKTESDSEDGVDRKLTALQELIEWSENMDLAIDFHKIGGFEILPQLFNSDVAELRWTSLELVATIAQNNPYCQSAVVEANFLPTMLELLDKDQNSTVKTKALYAISCLCRDHTESEKQFVDNDGFSVLMRAMQTDIDKLKMKASFFLSHLCNTQPAYKDVLCDIGMIDQLVGHLSEDHTVLHEHIMSALLSIVTNHARATAECHRPELGLHKLLKDRIDTLQGKEEFQEELDYARQLLQTISHDPAQDSGAR